MLYEESFKNNDFCQVIRNILYMDEEKKLITYFSHSELHTIGTTGRILEIFCLVCKAFGGQATIDVQHWLEKSVNLSRFQNLQFVSLLD